MEGILGTLHFLLNNLFGIALAIVVYFFMKIKANEDKGKLYREAYYKGQEDYSKMVPEQEARLEKLNAEYRKAFQKDWNDRKKEYRVGLIDGSRFIYQKQCLGDFKVPDGVDVLKSNRYRPVATMHWSESDFYDEIIGEYQYETGDYDD